MIYSNSVLHFIYFTVLHCISHKCCGVLYYIASTYVLYIQYFFQNRVGARGRVGRRVRRRAAKVVKLVIALVAVVVLLRRLRILDHYFNNKILVNLVLVIRNRVLNGVRGVRGRNVTKIIIRKYVYVVVTVLANVP